MPLHNWLIKFTKLLRKTNILYACLLIFLKALYTVNHSILLKKLELHGTTDTNYAWIKSYLSDRLQYIKIDENSRTEYCVVKCGVPQGSILGPLLFLLYVNDLKNASSILDPVMFADDTNLFYQTYESYFQQ